MSRPTAPPHRFPSWKRPLAARHLGAVVVLAALIGTPVVAPFPRVAAVVPSLIPIGTAAPASAGDASLNAASASLQAAWGFSPQTDPAVCLSTPVSCAGGFSAAASPSAAASTAAAPSAYNPPPSIGVSMAYDSLPNDQYVLLFGGLQQVNNPASPWRISNQTWAYAQGRWLNLTPFLKGTGPGPRWDATMAFDPNDGYVLLNGGCVAAPINGLCTRTFGDTWAYSNGRWKGVAPAPLPPPPPGPGPPPPAGITVPPARWDAAMTWDPFIRTAGGRTGAVVMYGGATGLYDTLPAPLVTATITALSDTWEWAPGCSQTTSWCQDSSAGPPAMYGARMATDTVSEVTVMFGGANFTRYDSASGYIPVVSAENATGQAFNATWELTTSGGWTKHTYAGHGLISGSSTPPARWDFEMAEQSSSFLSAGNAIVVMDGTNASGYALTDEWVLSSLFQGWTLITGPSAQPPVGGPVPRWDAAFTFDELDNQFLLFGGESLSGSALSDAWSLTLGGPWTPQIPNGAYPTSPGNRYATAAAYDDVARSAVLFGGTSCGAASCTFLGDTWTYVAGEWHHLNLPVAPQPRFGEALAYYPPSGVVVLFGGCGVICPMGDTWVYSASSAGVGSWTELFSPTAPPARYFATLTYNPEVQELVLFGGCEGSAGPCPTGDTWLYSGSGTWKHDTNAIGAAAPPARFGAASSYIPGEGVIVFGGMGASGPLQDTWNYSYHAVVTAMPAQVHPLANNLGWHSAGGANLPPARVFATLVYDRADHWLVLFGGCEPTKCPAMDPWIYNLTGGPKPPPGQPPPAPNPWWPEPKASPLNIPPVWNATLTPEYGIAGLWDPSEGSVGYILTFGGRGVSGATYAETASFVGNDWNNLGPFV